MGGFDKLRPQETDGYGEEGGCEEYVYTATTAFAYGVSVRFTASVQDKFSISEICGREEDLGGDFKCGEGFVEVGKALRAAAWVGEAEKGQSIVGGFSLFVEVPDTAQFHNEEA